MIDSHYSEKSKNRNTQLFGFAIIKVVADAFVEQHFDDVAPVGRCSILSLRSLSFPLKGTLHLFSLVVVTARHELDYGA